MKSGFFAQENLKAQIPNDKPACIGQANLEWQNLKFRTEQTNYQVL